tara:strand:+ start:11949 stop:12377 length:429 start_codon:yes stop_codon:yes gene_type:complete
MVSQDPQPEIYETVHDFASGAVQNTSVTKTVYTSQGSSEQVRIYAVAVRILDGTDYTEETTADNDFGLTIMAGANNVPSNEFHIGPVHASRMQTLTFASPILVDFKQPLQTRVRWLNASTPGQALRVKITLIGERGIKRSVN